MSITAVFDEMIIPVEIYLLNNSSKGRVYFTKGFMKKETCWKRLYVCIRLTF